MKQCISKFILKFKIEDINKMKKKRLCLEVKYGLSHEIGKRVLKNKNVD